MLGNDDALPPLNARHRTVTNLFEQGTVLNYLILLRIGDSQWVCDVIQGEAQSLSTYGPILGVTPGIREFSDTKIGGAN